MYTNTQYLIQIIKYLHFLGKNDFPNYVFSKGVAQDQYCLYCWNDIFSFDVIHRYFHLIQYIFY